MSLCGNRKLRADRARNRWLIAIISRCTTWADNGVGQSGNVVGKVLYLVGKYACLLFANLVNAFWHFMQAPRAGAVYNIGGSRHSHCSMVEAIASCERLTGRPLNLSYSDQNRTGDHIWWISDVRRFQSDYPGWQYRYDINSILSEIFEGLAWKLKSVKG